jgi:hypothetical protein
MTSSADEQASEIDGRRDVLEGRAGRRNALFAKSLPSTTAADLGNSTSIACNDEDTAVRSDDHDAFGEDYTVAIVAVQG